MDANSIASLLKPMNSTQIIQTLSTFQQSGLNISQIDTPAVLAQLNVTQIEGLLASNATVVTGLLQSLSPPQLVTILTNFQNVTSTLFNTSLQSNDKAIGETYAAQGKKLVTLLLVKMQTTFTDSQLLGVFKIFSNGAAYGTGSKKLLDTAKDLIKGFFGKFPVPSSVPVPSRLLQLVASYQPATFGGYPDHKDIAPSAIFMTLFFLLTLIYLGLYVKNRSLGHNFLITLGLAFYSLCRALGFLLRVVWSTDLTKIDVGLASTIFVVIPTTMLPSLNLILAQRFFTWKHPVYGSHKLFQAVMFTIYGFVIAVIIMTIIAAAVQINYFLSESHFRMTQRVLEASSVLIVIYSLISIVLVSSSYIIPPTSKDKKVLVYQPSWIKSFSWNYFVRKGAAQGEEATVSEDQKQHSIRIINSTTYHHESINQKQEEQEGPISSLKSGHSIVIIAFSTFALFLADMFRCVSTFIKQYEYAHSWIFDPVVMYVMFGALEVIVNLVFLFGRIDLRFYKPDAFKTSSSSQQSVQEAASTESNEEKHHDSDN